MFRSDWEIVSPTSWLGDFVDEEAFFSGRDLDLVGHPTVSLFVFAPETRAQESRGRARSGRRTTRPQRNQEQRSQGKPSDKRPESDQTPVIEKARTDDTQTEERKKLLNEDFFVDLPLGARAFETRMPAHATPPTAKTKDGYAYMTYAYSTCATLDDTGETVESTRRRYEDSSGVMKAVHRRQIGDRALESTWLKASPTDEGKHDKRVETAGDTAYDFERAWRMTPFGVAEKHALEQGEKTQTQLPDAPPPPEIP